jgi:hypothetical protein
MFCPGASARVYIAPGVTDMRKSINGLSLFVADQLELDPLSGYLFALEQSETRYNQNSLLGPQWFLSLAQEIGKGSFPVA